MILYALAQYQAFATKYAFLALFYAFCDDILNDDLNEWKIVYQDRSKG